MTNNTFGYTKVFSNFILIQSKLINPLLRYVIPVHFHP
ncbi:hypothetical protein [Salmonella enterica subsp. enterica serovar Rissen]|nr:hypothetical protein [Salmonella enterica subsp. enterica serovar Rissen]